MLDDIMSTMKFGDDSHFMGLIKVRKRKNNYMIIDGEQRLTAMLILLKAIEIIDDQSQTLTMQRYEDISDLGYEELFAYAEHNITKTGQLTLFSSHIIEELNNLAHESYYAEYYLDNDDSSDNDGQVVFEYLYNKIKTLLKENI